MLPISSSPINKINPNTTEQQTPNSPQFKILSALFTPDKTDSSSPSRKNKRSPENQNSQNRKEKYSKFRADQDIVFSAARSALGAGAAAVAAAAAAYSPVGAAAAAAQSPTGAAAAAAAAAQSPVGAAAAAAAAASLTPTRNLSLSPLAFESSGKESDSFSIPTDDSEESDFSFLPSNTAVKRTPSPAGTPASASPASPKIDSEEIRIEVSTKLKPQIIGNYGDNSQYTHSIMINGNEYKLKYLGQGQNHKVYEILDAISIQGHDLAPASSILKCANVSRGPNKVKGILEGGIISYLQMKREGLKLAQAYVFPHAFLDSVDPKNGGFWIIEKMKDVVSTSGWEGNKAIAQLSANDKQVLEFAKKYLTQSAREGREIINDFLPRNVMRNNQGELCIIDFSPRDNEDFEMNLFHYLLAWSSGNESVWNFLIEEFPVNIKETLGKQLAAERTKYAGQFPSKALKEAAAKAAAN